MAHAAERLPVTLDGRSYQIDPGEYSRSTVPLLREQQDNSTEPGEQTLNSQMWVRSQTDWSYGANQEFFDNDDSDRRRFYASSGVDVWTKGKASLLPICESKNGGEAFTDVILHSFTSVAGTDYLYVADGTDVYYSSDFDDATPTWNVLTALASPETITDMASDGVDVFICYGTARGLAKVAIGSTAQPSSLGSQEADHLAVIGGRLFLMLGGHIEEVAANGNIVSSSLNFDLEHGGDWVAIAAGPNGYIAAANVNGTGTMFFIQAASDGLLNQPQQTADLPHGEKINALESYGGLLALATNRGGRLAAMDTQAGAITYGPLVTEVGPVYSLASRDRFVWFGAASGVTGRADLSVFTGTLVPAFANDLVSVGSTPSDVTHIVRANGSMYFVDSANGVQGPAASGNLVESGYIMVGDVRWNSQYNKSLRQVEVRASPTLAAVADSADYNQAGETYNDADLAYNGIAQPVSGTIKVDFTPDTGVPLIQRTLSNRVPQNIEYSLSDKYTVKFTLERDASSPTAGPVLESWQIKAFPAPYRIDQIILPVMMQQRVATSRGMGAALQQDPQGEYDALRDIMESKRVVTYKEGSREDQVVIDQIVFAPEQLSRDGDWWEGMVTLKLLTVP